MQTVILRRHRFHLDRFQLPLDPADDAALRGKMRGHADDHQHGQAKGDRVSFDQIGDRAEKAEPSNIAALTIVLVW